MTRQKIADTLSPMTLSEILQELPRLTEEERQELREVLDGYDPEREHALAQLAKERFRGIKAGERITVDGDEVLAEGRRLAQKQAQQ
jgi:ribosome recycling factor